MSRILSCCSSSCSWRTFIVWSAVRVSWSAARSEARLCNGGSISVSSAIRSSSSPLLLTAGHQKKRALGAVGERLAEVAEYPIVHTVGVVPAEDDQLRAEFFGLVEDEIRQAVWAVTANVGRSLDPGFDKLLGDLLAESKRLWNRLFLHGRRGSDDPLPHVNHQDLRVECLGQPGDNRYNLFGVLRAAHRDEDLRKHRVALHWIYPGRKNRTIGRTHGRTRRALPRRAEKTTWRVGGLPEGKLGTSRPAREPRAGGGGRPGGRRGSTLAPLRVER